MVQEYVGGETLKERLDRLNQPMEEQEVLTYASQMLDILNDLAKQTPASAGTPGYAPLEQLQGNADPRSDLYALAATMHHLLTNRNPRNFPPFVYPMARMQNPQLSLEVERVL